MEQILSWLFASLSDKLPAFLAQVLSTQVAATWLPFFLSVTVLLLVAIICESQMVFSMLMALFSSSVRALTAACMGRHITLVQTGQLSIAKALLYLSFDLLGEKTFAL